MIKNIANKRTPLIKFIDYILYFFIFGGNTLISGSIVHALEFSVINIVMFFIGLFLTIAGTYWHEMFFTAKENRKEISLKNNIITIIIAVSSGSIAGGILHWEEGPKFGLYIVVSGFILSIITAILYNPKPIKDVLTSFFIKTGMFAGMSFVSGTIVHSVNIWFTNNYLIIVGVVLTVFCSLLNEALYKKRSVSYFVKEGILLLFLTIGIGGITGGVLHFTVNTIYALTIIVGGFAISVTASMFKNSGTLVELRK